jgi:hypothetical protein
MAEENKVVYKYELIENYQKIRYPDGRVEDTSKTSCFTIEGTTEQATEAAKIFESAIRNRGISGVNIRPIRQIKSQDD